MAATTSGHCCGGRSLALPLCDVTTSDCRPWVGESSASSLGPSAQEWGEWVSAPFGLPSEWVISCECSCNRGLTLREGGGTYAGLSPPGPVTNTRCTA